MDTGFILLLLLMVSVGYLFVILIIATASFWVTAKVGGSRDLVWGTFWGVAAVHGVRLVVG